MFSSSFIIVRLRDYFGPPWFLFPWAESHVMAILVVSALFFLKVWPIHFYFHRVKIMISSYSFPFLNNPNSWWNLYFTSFSTWESRQTFSKAPGFRPVQTYWFDFRGEYHGLLREHTLAFQTALGDENIYCTFLILAVISSCVPPVTVTMLPSREVQFSACDNSYNLRFYGAP